MGFLPAGEREEWTQRTARGVGESCSRRRLLFAHSQPRSRVKSPCSLCFPEWREIRALLLSFSLSHEHPLCRTAPLSRQAEGGGSGARGRHAGLLAAFPLNSSIYFSLLWKTDYLIFFPPHIRWLSLDFKSWVICSVGKPVSVLGLQTESLFCQPRFTARAVID